MACFDSKIQSSEMLIILCVVSLQVRLQVRIYTGNYNRGFLYTMRTSVTRAVLFDGT